MNGLNSLYGVNIFVGYLLWSPITYTWKCTNCYTMNKEKNLSPSQGLNLGLPITSQMLLPLRHQDS